MNPKKRSKELKRISRENLNGRYRLSMSVFLTVTLINLFSDLPEYQQDQRAIEHQRRHLHPLLLHGSLLSQAVYPVPLCDSYSQKQLITLTPTMMALPRRSAAAAAALHGCGQLIGPPGGADERGHRNQKQRFGRLDPVTARSRSDTPERR